DRLAGRVGLAIRGAQPQVHGSARVENRRVNEAGARAPAPVGVVGRSAVDARGREPAAAARVDANAERAVDDRCDQRVVDAPFDERQIVRARLEAQAVRLLLVADREADAGPAAVAEPEISNGLVRIRGLDFAAELPVVAEPPAELAPGSAD